MNRQARQNIVLASGKFDKEKSFWLEQLADVIPIAFPLDYPRLKTVEKNPAILEYTFDAETFSKVFKLARNLDQAAYMILVTAVNYLLHLYTNEDEIIVISPIPKPKQGQNPINELLPLRSLIDHKLTFKELLLKVRQTIVTADENQNYPLELIAEELNLLSDIQRTPFSNVVISFTGIHDPETLANYEYDLGFFFNKSLDRLTCMMQFDANLFATETIQSIISQLDYLLNVAITNPDKRLEELELVSASEKEHLLYRLNQTMIPIPTEQLVYQLFEEQVAKDPLRTALVFEEKQMSYGELNTRANQLAQTLRNQGVRSGEIIGLMVEPSFEMIIGILGIMKAGCAYLPIDYEYPLERIDYILEDSGTQLLLTHDYLISDLNFAGKIIDLTDEQNYQGDGENLVVVTEPQDLSYIIYTSGSTGKPKGVMVEQRNMLAYIHAFKQEYQIDQHDVVLQQASFAFDASVEEIFPILTEGGRLVLVQREVVRDVDRLMGILMKNKVTMISCSPLMLNELNRRPLIESIRIYISGGDVLKAEYYTNLIKRARVYNTYGPTEATVCVTYHQCQSTVDNEQHRSVPIGKPIANYQVLILDKNQRLLPLGIPGELCVAGAGVTRGYLNRPDLTQDKFAIFKDELGIITREVHRSSDGSNCVLDDQFDVSTGVRIYRTGDKARWLADGTIEFLGRIDNQVKIRGYRIELGEIESQLKRHQAISEAVVIAKTDPYGDKYLSAYLVLVEGEELSITEIREHLTAELPDYMIPAYFMELEEIPLTTSGKINRRALPEIEANLSTGIAYVAPETEVEIKITHIWSEVLNISEAEIGIDESFFVLGGQSFKAMLISAKLSKELGIDLPVRKIFEYPTIRELAAYLEGASGLATGLVISKAESMEYYPVSSAQKRIYVLHQLNPESITYNMPFVLNLQEMLDIDLVKTTLRCLLERHEALRTSFTLIDGQVVQIVHDIDFALEIPIIQTDEASLSDTLQELIQPFDLTKAPLLRMGFAQTDKRNVLILDIHHIIADGFSMEILTREFMELYQGTELADLSIQYKDYAVWQNAFLNSEIMKDQENYWLNKFSGELPVLNLPTDYPRPAIQDFAGAHYSFTLDEEYCRRLEELSRATGATLYMTLLAAYYLLLAKYTTQTDLIIGTPTAGRHLAGLEGVIGMFVNTLAIRAYPSEEKTFDQFLQEVRTETLAAFENQDYQFELLVEKLDLARDLSRNPLFDVLFVLQNLGQEKVEITERDTLDFDLQVSKFDLTLNALEIKNGMQFTFEYRSKLFKTDTIKRMATHLVNILKEISIHPQILLGRVNLLTDREREQILNEFNSPVVDGDERTISQVFAEVVRQNPEQIALVQGDLQLTYAELDQKSNQLARFLQAKGVCSDQIVGVLTSRSIELVIGMLGIIKAGGAYLPLDVDYPKERINYMLKDSNVQLLLTQERFIRSIEFSGEVLNLEDETIYEQIGEAIDGSFSRTQLAYVIYTSGSTGKPKGVILEHKGIVSLGTYFQKDLGICHTDRIIQFASCSFDASVWEMYMALLTGATLYLIDQDILNNYDQFMEFITTNEITVATLPPIYLRNLLPEKTPTLRKVITAGSKTDFELVRRWAEQVTYVNAYGPTEGTICATHWETTGEMLEYTSVPIGKPIHNTQVYILNSDGQLAPIGVAGELCISGVGLARGYLKRPTLTEERFVPNPFADTQTCKMYLTGDLARWLPDGNIEFLGRLDHQVKIRGHRIEIGEIENSLIEHPEIVETIVVAYQDNTGEHYLCAYYTVTNALSDEEIRQYLGDKLPGYMIPAYFLGLAQMPVTSSGKIDRKALPRPEDKVLKQTEYIPASTELEARLIEIYTQVLGIDNIGIAHNFFEIGGDSIKAMQVVARISKLGYYCQIQTILTNPTIAELATKVEKREESIEDGKMVQGELLPSPIQLRTLALDSYDKQHHHACPFFLELKEELDISHLQKALKQIFEQHDALRLNYDPEKKVFFHNNTFLEKEFEIPVYDLSKMLTPLQNIKISEYGTELMNSINLESDPYLKACIFDLGKRGMRLLIVVHHLVLDPASGIILIEDLIDYLTQLQETGEITNPPKTASFKDWTYAINQLAQSEQLLAEQKYWEQTLTTDFNMTQDYDKGAYTYDSCERVIVGLDELETENLLRKANHAYQTETSQLLITAMGLALSKFTGHKEVVFELENNGRNGLETGLDIFRTIGWFTAIYPVKFDFRQQVDLGAQIRHVKERLQKTPNQGVGYGMLKYITQANLPERKFEDTVIFNYIGRLDQSLNNQFFQPATENAGEICHPESSLIANLGVGCSINGGRFKIWFVYSKNKYRKRTIKKLADDYLDILRGIIEWCVRR